mgnify:CR=1 FL=1
MDYKELMNSSKNSLDGKWGLAVGTFSVFLLLSAGIQAASNEYQSLAIISAVISGPINVGLSIFALKISRNEAAGFEDTFSGFSNFINSFLAYLISMVIIIGGMILFIIPGIIAAIALSMTYFIIAEDNSISAINALKKSHAMMDGHKMDYFLLSIRYLLLAIACIFTLGIGFFWLAPYIYVTNAKFYEQIKNTQKFEYIP